MKDRILIILPSRGRPLKVLDSINSWRSTSTGKSDLILCLDEDDPTLEEYRNNCLTDYEVKMNTDGEFTIGTNNKLILKVSPRRRMCPTVNAVANFYAKEYKYLAFIGDDHVFRTKGWEDIAIQKIEANNGLGIVYGDDLYQHEALPTAAVMSSNIVSALGYMALPDTIHLFMDNFWLELGRALNALFYVPEIVIEHMHPVAGKGVQDAQYAEANSMTNFGNDQTIFTKWNAEQKQQDVEKILTYIKQ